MLQNTKLTLGKVISITPTKFKGEQRDTSSHGAIKNEMSIEKKSCKMVIAQEGHRLSKLRDKQRQSRCLHNFATQQRRQASHPKAGHFLEYFYQQQEVASQCSCQTFPRDVQTTRLVFS